MKLNGFCSFLLIAATFLVVPDLAAQVYRCETANGIEFSDMPCGESAEEIEIDVLEPAAQEAVESAEENAGALAAVDNVQVEGEEGSGEVHSLSDFTRMLEDQREAQIDEIDRSLIQLRAQADSPGFQSGDPNTRAQIEAQIAELETSRESILEQYETLIAEAQRRAE